MSTGPATEPRIRLGSGEDIVAAVPYLLGFHPTNSVILIALSSQHRGSRVGVVQRADLPAAEHETELATALIDNVVRSGADGAVLVLLSDPELDRGPCPPRASLAHAIEQAAGTAGIRISHALWAQGTHHDAQWRCYADPHCCGVLANPEISPLAAITVAGGHVTYASKEGLLAQLAPSDPDALLRRARTLRRLPEALPDPVRDYAAVSAAVSAAAAGALPTGDEQFVELARALDHEVVRDVALGTALGPEALAAERLWVELVRGTPPPHRAAPAALLGFSAWVRGDGALASVALANALLALPGYPLAALLQTVLQHAVPPETIRAIAQSSVDEATKLLDRLAATGPTPE